MPVGPDFIRAPGPFLSREYSLKSHRIRSLDPAHYAGWTQYVDSQPANKNYIFATEVEQGYGQPYPQGSTRGQCLPVNVPGGAVQMVWGGNSTSGYNVHLYTDYMTITPPPAGANGTETWIAFTDDYSSGDFGYNGGGYLPRPDKLVTSVSTFWGYQNPNGWARSFVAAAFFWQTPGPFNFSCDIEICFDISPNWPDQHPNEPDIIAAVPQPQYNFIVLNGPAIGISSPQGVNAQLTVDWLAVLNGLIGRTDPVSGGVYLPAPVSWETSSTYRVKIGTAVTTLDATAPAVAASLYFQGLTQQSK